MKALEAQFILPDLSSIHTLHGTGQSLACGCEAGLRRKRSQVDIIGHRRQHPVELNNVLRAVGRGGGGKAFRRHRNQAHRSPGPPRARGTLLHGWRIQTTCATPRSR